MYEAINKSSTAPEDTLPKPIRNSFKARAGGLNVTKNKVIITQDDEKNEVYLLESGRVEISLWSIDSSETIFREVYAGQMFGELSAIDSRPRSVSAIALENCHLYRMSGRQFKYLLIEDLEFRSWFDLFMVNRIRSLSERVFELSRLNLGPRLWKEILRLAMTSKVESDSVIIKNFPSQQKLAARLGAGREAVNKELGAIVTNNIVEKLGRGTIRVISVSALQSMIQSE